MPVSNGLPIISQLTKVVRVGEISELVWLIQLSNTLRDPIPNVSFIISQPELAQLCFIRVCPMTSASKLYWSDYF